MDVVVKLFIMAFEPSAGGWRVETVKSTILVLLVLVNSDKAGDGDILLLKAARIDIQAVVTQI